MFQTLGVRCGGSPQVARLAVDSVLCSGVGPCVHRSAGMQQALDWAVDTGFYYLPVVYLLPTSGPLCLQQFFGKGQQPGGTSVARLADSQEKQKLCLQRLPQFRGSDP